VTLPGRTPSTSWSNSAAPNEKRGAPVRERLQVDAAFLERDDEPETGLLILEEEALAVPARQRAAQRLRLLDGEDRRVGVGLVRDAEPVQFGEELVGGQVSGHPGTMRRAAFGVQELA